MRANSPASEIFLEKKERNFILRFKDQAARTVFEQNKKSNIFSDAPSYNRKSTSHLNFWEQIKSIAENLQWNHFIQDGLNSLSSVLTES